jgi:hypothetical protein
VRPVHNELAARPARAVLARAVLARVVLVTGVLVTGVLAASGATAEAAPARVPAGVPAFFPGFALGNPGAVSPSLGLSVGAGDPEIAAIGSRDSLQYYTKVSGKWTHKQLAGSNSAFAGASLISGPGDDALVAVEGPGHSLVVYLKSAGHWTKANVAGRGTTYSAPSLAFAGEPVIAAEGRNQSLWYYYFLGSGWHSKEVLGAGRAYSAPSVVLRAGVADIAVQGANHTLSYLSASASNPQHWTDAVIGGVGTTYSAPSLAAVGAGQAAVAVEGPHHDLVAFSGGHGWSSTKLESNGRCYSAPSLRENASDPTRPVEIAFQSASHSLTLLFFNAGSARPHWENDVITRANGAVDSAPSLFDRRSNPAGEADLAFQGRGNTLWYYHAAKPPTAGLAPGFTGVRIGGPGSTFGG